MPIPSVSPSRFPGLTLRAWVLCSGGAAPVILQSYNIASIQTYTAGSGNYVFNFQTALPSSQGAAIDLSAASGIATTCQANAVSLYVTFQNVVQQATQPGGFFAAVYQ